MTWTMKLSATSIALVSLALLGCGRSSAPTTPVAIHQLNITEGNENGATAAYRIAKLGYPLTHHYFTFESETAMNRFITAANEARDLDATVYYVRNPGLFLVAIRIEDNSFADSTDSALDELSVEQGGMNATDAPYPLDGPGEGIALWMPCRESNYVGPEQEWNNELTEVTMAFSFDDERDARGATYYFAADYKTIIISKNDGGHSLHVTRTMKYGDTTHEADGIEEWIAALRGSFDWYEAGYTEQ